MPDSNRSSRNADPHLWIQILAGGIGSRFWPASTRDRPKQLLPLASERPLIVDTVERARSLVPDDHIRVLAGEHLAAPFRRALPDLPEESYLVEPEARGTCPVLAWAAWEMARLDPDAILVSLHSDHLIRPLEGFQDTVNAAAALARDEEVLVTVGVEPDRVETGYGHIQPGARMDLGGAEAYRVAAFHEKPDADTALRYMEEGYLWNTGIFVWKASVFLEEIHRHAPEVAAGFPTLEERGAEAFFQAVPVCVVDRAVMERTDRAATVKAAFSWDDVGSWEALGRTRSGDAAGNVVEGSGRVVEGSGNVVYAEGADNVVLFGMDDTVVVQAGGTTLVMPRERAAGLKELLSRLEEGP